MIVRTSASHQCTSARRDPFATPRPRQQHPRLRSTRRGISSRCGGSRPRVPIPCPCQPPPSTSPRPTRRGDNQPPPRRHPCSNPMPAPRPSTPRSDFIYFENRIFSIIFKADYTSSRTATPTELYYAPGLLLFFFVFSISGIKRARAVVSPAVQMNADLSTTARAFSFSPALSTQPTPPPM